MLCLLAAAAAGCGVFTKSHAVPPGVPENSSDAITDKWSDWLLAPPAAAPAGCTDTGLATGPVIKGDFDGDGTQDVAVMITVNGTPHLAVVLSRATAPAVYELALPAGGLSQALALHKRGARYRTATATVDDYLVADTLGTDACGAAGEIWLWSGDNFKRLPLKH